MIWLRIRASDAGNRQFRGGGTGMGGDDAVQLYWSGGSFCVGLAHRPRAFSPDALAMGVAVLGEFRAECHRAYFAFNGLLNGRVAASIKYGKLFLKREARFSVGTAFPDGQQRPGQSTITQLNQGELLDSLGAGGDVEDRQNKALIVMLYHRWEESYRYRIGEVLGLRKDDVRCTLMGELRLPRNLIVHENGVVLDSFSAPFLSRIWGGIGPGHFVSTDRMVHALMEQLNAIRVEAG